MKLRLAFVALTIALAGSLVATTTASATWKPPTAKAIGTVTAHKDGTATVWAIYNCPKGEDWHLWVSAKQTADGKKDPAIEAEGGGFGHVPASWLQSHPTNFRCNGRWQIQRFRIDTAEQGYGELVRGTAWVQFCLINEPAGLFLIDQHWMKVRKAHRWW